MGRAIASVVVGYIVIALFVFVTFSITYLILGADGSYRPGTYEVSAVWIGVSVVLSFAAAVLGGWVAARIARAPTPPKVLAGLVLVLGLAMALMTATPDTPTVRTAAPGVFEAAAQSRQPEWLLYLNPLLGFVGVLVGASLVSHASAPRETELPPAA
jgi:hypothetical protein